MHIQDVDTATHANKKTPMHYLCKLPPPAALLCCTKPCPIVIVVAWLASLTLGHAQARM